MKTIRITSKGAIIVAVVLAILGLALLSACGSGSAAKSKELTWTILRSPITGRYYEVATQSLGTQQGVMSMGEVTKAEYDNYVEAHCP